MVQSIDLTKPIQVRTGDYRRKWVDVKITHVGIGVVGYDADEGAVYGLSFSVKFLGEEDKGCVQHVSDAFGWGSEEWRYKEECCEQCKFCSKTGGDIVHYGSTTATLLEGYECDCPDMPEDVEDPYSYTEGGTKCTYHKFAEES